jgi:hypothetical protein
MSEDIWKNLIEYRAQTSSWDLTKTVDRKIIDDVVSEIHRRCPSKQNRVPYELHILDWSNTELRNDFYEFAVDRDNPNPRYNSQTLGHYLIVFVGRTPKEFDLDFSDLKGKLDEKLSHLEIGLASHMLVHGLKVRDIDSGFCRCFDYNSVYAEKVKNGLGIKNIHHVFLSIGVGIENKDRYKTKNLHTNQLVEAWKDNGEKWYREPKPDPSDYIIYHTE